MKTVGKDTSTICPALCQFVQHAHSNKYVRNVRGQHNCHCVYPVCFCKVMESKHDYEALTDEMLFLEIKGAAKMVVTFDERSRTEDRCERAVVCNIYKRQNRTSVLPRFFSAMTVARKSTMEPHATCFRSVLQVRGRFRLTSCPNSTSHPF